MQTFVTMFLLKYTCTVHSSAPVPVSVNILAYIFSCHFRGRPGRSGHPKLSHFSLFSSSERSGFYIGYIERIFHKTITSLQNYRKRSKTSPYFKFVRLSLIYYLNIVYLSSFNLSNQLSLSE